MRYCIRRAKDVCYVCCNDLRIDGNCPDTCAYRLRTSETALPFATKVDSQTEYTDLLKKALTHWANKPFALFGGVAPAALTGSSEGKQRLREFFAGLSLPPGFPSRYLAERWEIDHFPEPPAISTPEDTAVEFIHRVEEDDWAGAALLYADEGDESNTFRRDSLSADKGLRSAEVFDILSSGLSDKGTGGFVQIEINHRDSLVLVMVRVNDSYRILQRIWGTPEAIAGEKEAWKPVALNLSKNQLGDAHDGLKAQQKVYPDSADTFYYLGLYHFLSNHADDAVTNFQKAVWIDPHFTEARYNLAALQQVTGKSEAAEIHYRKLLEFNPQDVRCMNNLAAILIDRGDRDRARELLDRCLKLQPDFEMARKNLERISPEATV
jgi:tetratricopeptide (TPR) repeat protein